jgi:hypothetical protein|tara:strand:+ start:349 stop:699 length:351 start_codon:yes stop_codon:yes gene_type:complete
MAAEWKHKRYFRVRGSDSSLKTFSSTSDANTKIGFTSVYSTSSPTKTEALADSDKTLVVTYEFDNISEQTAFKSAIDGAWSDSTSPFNPATDTDTVEHFKTEWLNADGSVSSTTNL